MADPIADATITVVPWDDDDVARLRDEQQAELATRYEIGRASCRERV